MIQYLKAKDHKGVKIVLLENLGKINVLSGRNNSGKSSILEALTSQNKFAIGKKVEGLDWVCELFDPQARQYTTPAPETSRAWFRQLIEKVISEQTVWYTDDTSRVTQMFNDSMRHFHPLARHAQGIFKFDQFFERFFGKCTNSYNPTLIPPKRSVGYQVTIATDEELQPSGQGIVNRLFFLKNQDIKSEVYTTYTRIYDAFDRITGCNFNIVPGKDNKLGLVFRSGDSQWLAADVCGLGLSDVLIILSILLATDSTFVFIEEPENHLHAEYQKRLLRFLARATDKQLLITTHSSVFIDPLLVDRIFYVTCEKEVTVSDRTTKSAIIRSLGYSATENLVADCIILTEGPTDVPIVSEALRWMGIEDKYNVRYWPLGGDIMSSLDLSVFSERSNVFAIIDCDPKSSVQRTRFERKCRDSGVKCFRLSRYSIENYLSLKALRAVFPRQIPTKIKQLEPARSIDDQIGFKTRGKSIKGKNHEIIREMTLEDLKDTDLLSALMCVKETLESSAKDGKIGAI